MRNEVARESRCMAGAARAPQVRQRQPDALRLRALAHGGLLAGATLWVVPMAASTAASHARPCTTSATYCAWLCNKRCSARGAQPCSRSAACSRARAQPIEPSRGPAPTRAVRPGARGARGVPLRGGAWSPVQPRCRAGRARQARRARRPIVRRSLKPYTTLSRRRPRHAGQVRGGAGARTRAAPGRVPRGAAHAPDP